MSWLSRLFGAGSSPEPSRVNPPVQLAPTRGFKFEIVGEGSYQEALSRIVGGKREKAASFETTAHILLEPTNPHDANAVVVKIQGKTVGYLSRDDTMEFRAELANLDPTMPTCIAKAKIVGGWEDEYSEGSFGVKLNIKRPLQRKKT